MAEPLRILTAEDDDVSLQPSRRALEKSGYTVAGAVNGQEALQRLTEQVFDLILMDIQMSIMDGVEDGVEATRAIRAGEAGQGKTDVPIVVMTAYAMVGDKEKYLEAGMDDYISKPVAMDELRLVIEGVMKKKGNVHAPCPEKEDFHEHGSSSCFCNHSRRDGVVSNKQRGSWGSHSLPTRLGFESTVSQGALPAFPGYAAFGNRTG